MKRAITIILLAVFMLIINSIQDRAQDRINSKPLSLSYKSKELRKATYWEQDQGKWVSRNNTKIEYQSGVHSKNFKSIFFGRIDSVSMIFIDYSQGRYKYPNLELEWGYYPEIHSAVIDKDKCSQMKNIQPNQIVSITSRYTNKINKLHPEYNFSLFLDLSRTLYETDILLKEKHVDLYILSAYRTRNKGVDVVRFDIFPYPWAVEMGNPEFTNWYFEVTYKDFMVLFDEDSKKTYK